MTRGGGPEHESSHSVVCAALIAAQSRQRVRLRRRSGRTGANSGIRNYWQDHSGGRCVIEADDRVLQEAGVVVGQVDAQTGARVEVGIHGVVAGVAVVVDRVRVI